MSFQEKRNLVYLLSTILVFGAYGLYIWQGFRDRTLDALTPPSYWATTILILVGVGIVVSVVLLIAFYIVHTIQTRKEEPDITDEMDKVIELKAVRNAYYFFMLGFLVALVTVALGQPLFVMFNVFVLFLFLSQAAWVLTTLYFYRRGF